MSWRLHKDAPSPGFKLCQREAIPDGGCLEVRCGQGADDLRLLVMRSAETVWAYVNRCPHFSLPLNARPNTFLITGQRQIMCAFHCAVFNFEDGRCVEGPAMGMGLESVPVTVHNGDILVA
jgi:nitrite reductase/ring-hydroxylating ferredoxin subunit